MTSAVLAPGKVRSAKRVLPGFGLTLGYTIFYLSIVVLIPLVALLSASFSLTWEQFWNAVSAPAVVASYELSFTKDFNVPMGPETSFGKGQRFNDIYLHGQIISAGVLCCPEIQRSTGICDAPW